jgi:hypothetical protein
MKILDKKDDPDFGTLYKFEHEATPINGIEGKTFIDFTQASTADFGKINDEICLALATTPLDNYPIVGGVTPPELAVSELDAKFENEIMYNYSGDREVLKALTPMERRKYLIFKYGSCSPWCFILNIKPSTFANRMKDEQPWGPIAQKLPLLKQCVEQLPFSEIGRVVIYGSWQEARVPCHRDTYPTKAYGHQINFNPGGPRPVYVYDPVAQVKHYLPPEYKFYSYNVTDYHGVDPLPVFSYTVRVDGTFNEQAFAMIGSTNS